MDGPLIFGLAIAALLVPVGLYVRHRLKPSVRKSLTEIFACPACQEVERVDESHIFYKPVTFDEGDIREKANPATLAYLHSVLGPTFHVRYFTSTYLLEDGEDPKLFVDVYSESRGNIQMRLS